VSFDPVSFALGAASGGGGGGGGGGFTLLHGTFSEDEQGPHITLTITASELYALMLTSTVAFDYTTATETSSTTCVLTIDSAGFLVETGLADDYSFYIASAPLAAQGLEATDPVVFSSGH
jgi:hypothetical protein